MGNWFEDQGRDRDAQKGMAALGIVLIVLGGLFLLSEQLNVDWNARGWPMYVIVPGLVLLVAGLAIPHEVGLGIAVPGGMITTVGLLLAYQDYYDQWASWAYVWPLVAPGSVGVTMTAHGILHRSMDLLDAGLRTAAVGLGLFVGFGLFFVNVIRIDNGRQPEILQRGLPILAIALGLLIVAVALLPRRSGGESGSSTAGSTPPDSSSQWQRK
jgi:hypothetical protein